MPSDESEFESAAAATLDSLAERLDEAPEEIEADLEGGVLSVEVEGLGTFIVNRHAPLRQLWLSSPVSGASHYARDADGRWQGTRGEGRLEDRLAADLAPAGFISGLS
ncbi:MAG TPA: iron donor protein CyaY [Alphaproteobacteria bacterium]|jgi:frataxin|nr:iron donor protein CyaY [Alphaproteobacteria bacterium]HJP21219.1 iron donor protein CyaY [Alphaproteobacteria bacterium]